MIKETNEEDMNEKKSVERVFDEDTELKEIDSETTNLRNDGNDQEMEMIRIR